MKGAAGEGVGRVEAARDVLHVEAKLLKLVEPTREKAVDVPLRAQPGDCLVVRPEREVREDPRRTWGAAAKEVVAEHAQGVDHSKEFEDVRQVGLLCGGELAAFVGDRMLMAFVIGLRENGGDCRLAGVGSQHGSPAGVESAQDWGRRQATLQLVEALLLRGAPLPGSVRTTQPCERGRNVGIPVHEAAVVVTQADELAQFNIGRWGRPIANGGDLTLVDRHALPRNPMTQEAQLLATEGTLRCLHVQLLLPQDGQNLSYVTEMLLQRGAIAEEVVHVHDHRPVQGACRPRDAPG